MGIGDFVDDYRGKLVEDSTKAWIGSPSTWDKGNAEEQWEIIKQSAKDAGMSVLDWFSEVAFKGSQNPQGWGQEMLGAASYPFRKTAEVSYDYLDPWSTVDEQGSPAGFMHSEQMPEWLSGLNDPAMQRYMIQNPGIPAAGAMLGSFGIPANKWAEGENVLKGDVAVGLQSLATPFLPWSMGSRAATRLPRSPSMPEDTDDFIVDAIFEETPNLETKLKSKGYETEKTLDELSDIERPAIWQISADEWDAIEPRIKSEWLQRESMTEVDMTAFHYLNEGRERLLALVKYMKKSKDFDNIDLHVYEDIIKKSDKKILNLPDTPFMQVLREGDAPTEKVAKTFRRIKRTGKLTEELDLANNLAKKMAMKPSHVDASDWEKLVEGLDDMGEVRNIARRMTLRIVD